MATPQPTAAVDGHQCDICGSLFATEDVRDRHQKRHFSSGKEKCYRCNLCSYSTSKSNDLKKHIFTHTGEKPNVCSVCSRTFARKSYLQKHLRTHTGEMPYVCESCGKAFHGINELRRHKGVHSGERPFLCSTCGKGFKQTTDLRKHEQMHSGLRPHWCPHCDYKAALSGTLKDHITSRHKKTYQKGFLLHSQLSTHMAIEHPDRQLKSEDF